MCFAHCHEVSTRDQLKAGQRIDTNRNDTATINQILFEQLSKMNLYLRDYILVWQFTKHVCQTKRRQILLYFIIYRWTSRNAELWWRTKAGFFIVHDAALSLLSQHCTVKKAITFPNPSPTSAPHPCSRTPCEDSDRQLIKFTCSSLPGHRNMSGSPMKLSILYEISLLLDLRYGPVWSWSQEHMCLYVCGCTLYIISHIYIYTHSYIA